MQCLQYALPTPDAHYLFKSSDGIISGPMLIAHAMTRRSCRFVTFKLFAEIRLLQNLFFVWPRYRSGLNEVRRFRRLVLSFVATVRFDQNHQSALAHSIC